MDFISAQEAANRLEVTIGFIYQLIRQGRLKAKKFSGVWLIDPEDLDSVEVRRKGNFKLTEEQIRQIKILYDKGMEIPDLAEKFDVSERTIYRYI